jgi:GT2 family glycosyltransferase
VTASAPLVSVIVPTIGRPDSLAQLLESLATQTRRPDEVIVADGSSDDAIAAVVSPQGWGARGLHVRRIATHPPNAVSQRVAAIAQARGQYLLLLDDDVVLEPDCVEQLMSALAADDQVVAAMADFNNQSWPEPTRAWRFYLRYGLGMADGAWQGQVVGPLLRFGHRPGRGAPLPMAWLSTCNTLIRRSAYDQAGGFSDFFLHRSTINEDLDLGLKVARVGRVVLCPSARLGHFQAPGGRVSVAVAAEDDLYNRYLIMRRTQRRTAAAAFGLAAMYFAVETVSSLAGGVWRLQASGFGARLRGRLKALARILFGQAAAS